MKKIAFFSIPAHGHTNPMLPVAAELVSRGNIVRFYSFNEFENKIQKTGATFVSCDSFLPKLTSRERRKLKAVSTTEMTIQDIRITLSMDRFLRDEFSAFQPDVVYTDSVCFWGKLTAWKHNIPMVVSTSTFAFNQLSSQYMKNSPGELVDMILGLPKISKELKKLEPYGYHVNNALSLVQNDNHTDTVVYTSRKFQPYAESFSDHYAFVGPSLFTKLLPRKRTDRPTVYISMGTILNERPGFYKNCIAALGCINADVIISAGNSMDPAALGKLPDNIKIFPYVDQLDILSRANVFITHCGMNSVSESLYMATPMILYPQTGEQHAAARRVVEIGAGKLLKDDSPEHIRALVKELLDDPAYANAASECSRDFRSASGAVGAAEHIENAPHTAADNPIICELNRANAKFQRRYWLAVMTLIILLGICISWKYVWIISVAAGVFSNYFGKIIQSKTYKKLADRNNP